MHGDLIRFGHQNQLQHFELQRQVLAVELHHRNSEEFHQAREDEAFVQIHSP
jgi:hypothetical protein